MGCYYPLPATRLRSGKITIHKRVTNYTRRPSDPRLAKDLNLPCGKCIGCRIQRAQHWAIRCLHESTLHNDNCFLTLTYRDRKELDSSTPRRVDDREIRADLTTNAQRARSANARSQKSLMWTARLKEQEHEPDGDTVSLSKTDHQKFVKRLRHHTGPLRYYMCGEYGEKLRRPHYHYLIFGYDFKDKTYLKTSESGEKLYRSVQLDQIWTHGHAWIGDVTYDSCAYVAAYIMKKIDGPMAANHYDGRTPEFNYMSRNPGIAKHWWMKHHQDVTTLDRVVKKNGGTMKPPRYYDKQLEKVDPALWEQTKFQREAKAKELASDNTPARLAVKETVTKARIAMKHRNLENSK